MSGRGVGVGEWRQLDMIPEIELFQSGVYPFEHFIKALRI